MTNIQDLTVKQRFFNMKSSNGFGIFNPKDKEQMTKGLHGLYVGLPHLIDHLNKYCATHGLTWYQEQKINQSPLPVLEIVTYFLDDLGNEFTKVWQYLLDPVGGAVHTTKNSPQNMGTLGTYARRYALYAILGICPDTDTDGSSVYDAWIKGRNEDDLYRELTAILLDTESDNVNDKISAVKNLIALKSAEGVVLTKEHLQELKKIKDELIDIDRKRSNFNVTTTLTPETVEGNVMLTQGELRQKLAKIKAEIDMEKATAEAKRNKS